MSSTPLWYDGKIVDLLEAGISPLANALHYGTGVFEGIRAYETPTGPAIFRLAEHLDRMALGANHLGMSLDLDALTAGHHDILAASGLQNAYLRPLAFYESGGLGLDVASLQKRTLVAAIPWSTHLGEASRTHGISLRTSSWRRIPATSVPALKLCGNYVNSILAKREATLAGFQEALFVDDHGFVCEGSAENVFLVKNGRIVAVAHPDMLPGITRRTICELTGAESRPVTLAELRDADEIFLTGTSVEVTGVCQLDSRPLPIGPITRQIAALYQAVVHGQTETERGWLCAA